MKELTTLFHALWGTFLMRDVVGKAVPGATVLIATGAALAEVTGKTIPDVLAGLSLGDMPGPISTLLAVGILGMSYIAGFVAQTVAFNSKWCSRLFKHDAWERIIKDRFRVGEVRQAIDGLNPSGRQKLARSLHTIFSLKEFGSLADREPVRWYQRERFVVIKEMAANMSMALALAVCIIFIGDLTLFLTADPKTSFALDPGEALGIALMVLALIVLWRCHKAHRELQTEYEIRILNLDSAFLATVVGRELEDMGVKVEPKQQR